MIPVDPHVTAIDSASSAIQVAQGSVITDGSGSRQATLLIMTGTQATMIFAGGLTETLSTFNVRLTEYTVGAAGPQAMPGELPPQSGYTYAAEYSVDEAVAAGALNVAFSQPLIHYSQNFLTFTVGTAVPVGYYDRVNSQWVASPNGRVIRIVAITDTLAYLDTDTTPGIDNGVALGVTVAEREALAALYPAGQTLWRVPITHFSPWDCNWPYGPPSDAVAPNLPTPVPEESPLPKDCDKKGSIIGCESQRLGEAAGLAGTPFILHYSSDRVPGGTKNAYRLTIPLSGSSLPASLKRIDLEVSVAGRTFKQAFSPAPNLSYEFIWDGKDAYGRTVQGSQPARARIGYVYDAVYRTPMELVQAFGQFGPAVTAVRARSEVVIWQEWEGLLGAMDMGGVGLGGWDLDAHHTYDSGGHVLYMGDGTRRSAEAQSDLVISTVAGTGATSSSGDGLPATQAGVWQPINVAVGPDGQLVHQRVAEFSRSPGRAGWDHHHGGRYIHDYRRLQWRRHSGHSGAAQLCLGSGRGAGRQSVHCRHGKPAGSPGRTGRDHHHGGRHGHRRLQRRRDPRHPGPAQQALRRGRGAGRQSLHLRRIQLPRSPGEPGRDHHYRGRQRDRLRRSGDTLVATALSPLWPGCGHPSASPWTRPAGCTSQRASACAGWARTGSSGPWPALAPTGTVATAGRPSTPRSGHPATWRRGRMAASTSPSRAISAASAGWAPTGSSPPWPVPAPAATTATGCWPPRPCSAIPMAWTWGRTAAFTSPIAAITASAGWFRPWPGSLPATP